MVNRMPMRRRSSRSTIAAGSCGPRDDPRIDPPISWIRLTTSGVSVQRFVTVPLDEALEPEAESVNRPHTVMMVKAQHDRADHVVHAGAEPAARDDAARQRRRVEEEPLPGPAHSIAGGSSPNCRSRLRSPSVDGYRTRILIVDESHPGHRRHDSAVAEARDREVEAAVSSRPLPGHGFTRAIPADRRSVAARLTRSAIACSARAR